MACTDSATEETMVPAKKVYDENAALLEGTDEAWEQYKLGKGTLVTNAKELDAFLDKL
jgi:hypothetical protein